MRFVVVVRVPVQVEVVIGVDRVGRWQFHVHHDPARTQHPVRLAQHLAIGARRLLVQEKARYDQIETRIGVVERARILLRVVHGITQRAGSGMCVAQQRG